MGQQQSAIPAEASEQYLGPAISEPWTRMLLRYDGPQPGGRALYVACGNGVLARHVVPMVGTEGKVVALNISREMLAIARAIPAPKGATIGWGVRNAISFALQHGAFGLILCQQALKFFSYCLACVQEISQFLADGRRAAASIWQALQRHAVYAALFETATRHLGTYNSDGSLPFSLSDSEELCALRGIQTFSASKSHHTL